MWILGPLLVCIIALLVVRTFITAAWSGYLYLFDDQGRCISKEEASAIFMRSTAPDGSPAWERIRTDVALRQGNFSYDADGMHEGEGFFIFSPTPLPFDEMLEVLGELPRQA
jgi:hypothetical protein